MGIIQLLLHVSTSTMPHSIMPTEMTTTIPTPMAKVPPTVPPIPSPQIQLARQTSRIHTVTLKIVNHGSHVHHGAVLPVQPLILFAAVFSPSMDSCQHMTSSTCDNTVQSKRSGSNFNTLTLRLSTTTETSPMPMSIKSEEPSHPSPTSFSPLPKSSTSLHHVTQAT